MSNACSLYEYDQNSRKISETDANGSRQYWEYDAFGQLLSHTQMESSGISSGGALISYFYNEAGQLTEQRSSAGQETRYAYDRAGHLVEIVDAGQSTGLDLGINRVTQYRYDEAGRQSRETVIVDGRIHQDTKIHYDAHNRADALDDPDYREQIAFDANGNRSRVTSYYVDDSNRMRVGDIKYLYDEMNRVMERAEYPMGDLDTTQVTAITYNARGDRTESRVTGNPWAYGQINGSGGEVDYYVDGTVFTNVTEDYDYDGLGRLISVEHEVIDATTGAHSFVQTHSYTYDKASRIINEGDATIGRDEHGHSELQHRNTIFTYDDEGRTIEQTTRRNGVELESIVREGLIYPVRMMHD